MAPVCVALIALVLRVWMGVGFVNYDSLYALVWGQQMSRGELPQYRLALAPTPHPLLELLGLIVSPLGATWSEQTVVVLAYLALGALGFIVFRLGQAWFSTAVGVLAALVLLTREPVLSYGVRAYVDIPYVCLVLGALLVETRRRFAGAPVLILLTLAGLLRPEAWLLATVYWTYCARYGHFERRQALQFAVLVAAAPVIWAVSDLAVTGDLLWSLTQTQDSAVTLHRATGLQNVPVTGAHRLGEILRPDGLVAAAIGGAYSVALLRRRVQVPLAAVVVASCAVAILASAGLPINTRYVLLTASVLAVFAAAALLGWLSVPAGTSSRRAWRITAVAVAVLMLAFIPSQSSRLRDTIVTLHRQQRVEDDLVALVRANRRSLAWCGPIQIRGHRELPQIALIMRTRPGALVRSAADRVVWGSYLTTTTTAVARDYRLDPSEPVGPAVRPRGFTVVARNASWVLAQRCFARTRGA